MHFRQWKRRQFISLLGSAAVAWPLVARAQQPKMPVIGFLNGGAANASERYLAAFRQGLSETGFSEGRNVTVEYHWMEGQYNRVPALVADLVRRQVAVIASPGFPSVRSRPKLRPRRSRSSSGLGTIQSSSVGRKPRTARRQCDRHQFSRARDCVQTARIAAGAYSEGCSYCRSGQSRQCSGGRSHVERSTRSRANPWDANPCFQRQHHRRDRRSLCSHRARTG